MPMVIIQVVARMARFYWAWILLKLILFGYLWNIAPVIILGYLIYLLDCAALQQNLDTKIAQEELMAERKDSSSKSTTCENEKKSAQVDPGNTGCLTDGQKMQLKEESTETGETKVGLHSQMECEKLDGTAASTVQPITNVAPVLVKKGSFEEKQQIPIQEESTKTAEKMVGVLSQMESEELKLNEALTIQPTMKVASAQSIGYLSKDICQDY